MESNFRTKKLGNSLLQHRILEMFDRQDNVDVKFKVTVQTTSKTFKAHALILAIRSPVLADAFCKTDEEPTPLVINSSVKGFEILLRYLYTGCISSSCPEELIEMSKAARQLQIGGTTSLCKDKLENIPININNICLMLKASQYFKMENKKQRCLSLIQKIPNEELFECKDFKNTTKEIVSTILSHKKLSFLPTVDVAIRWLQEQRKKGESGRNVGLRIPPLSSGEFMEIVDKFPSFSSCKFFKGVTSILGNTLGPGFFNVPQNWDTSDIIDSVLRVETDCIKYFPKFQLYGENEFETSVIFEIKVSRKFPRDLHLVLLELVFGTNFVPAKNLELELFQFEPNSDFKTSVPFTLMSSPEKFHIYFKRKIPVPACIPLVFCLRLRAFGLKKWEGDSPVSDGSYRVAKVPGDIFNNLRLKVFGHESMCITFLSDWLVFIDPIRQKKRPFLASLVYFQFLYP